jgi:hypothetical protein
MTTIDLIAHERLRYLGSARTRRDQDRYLAAVQQLRFQREGRRSPCPVPASTRRSTLDY